MLFEKVVKLDSIHSDVGYMNINLSFKYISVLKVNFVSVNLLSTLYEKEYHKLTIL